MFRRYLDARLSAYANADSESTAMAKYDESVALQGRIWESATAAVTRPDVRSQVITLLMPALNEMFDIATTRLVAVRNHPPPVVFAFLFLMAFIGALLVGYNDAANKGRSVFHSTLYCIVIFLAMYVILDLEFPRQGLVRIDRADLVLLDLRKSPD